MGLLFRHPRIKTEHQEAAARKLGVTWFLTVGEDVKSWREAVAQVRPGDVVFVYAGVMVPGSKKLIGMSLPAQWAAFMTELHSRGGTLVEVVTGRKSANLKEQRELNEETLRLLRSGGKKLPATRDAPGRPPVEWPSPEIETQARAIWANPHYATREAAIAHMPEGVTPTLIKRLGPRLPLLKKRKR